VSNVRDISDEFQLRDGIPLEGM